MAKVKKVPMIMQMEAVECGAASLAMILAYHGKWLPLERVRADCGVSRDGSSARSIIRAARGYGLKATAYKVGLEDLPDMAPCICHWNFEHFLVFCGYKGGCACLNDPGLGQVKVPMNEFRRSFTGVAMEFEPTEEFVRDGSQTSVTSYIYKRMKGAREALWLTLILGLFGAAVNLALPLFTQAFTDNVLNGEHREWMKVILWLMGGMAVFNLVYSILNNLCRNLIAGGMSLTGNSSFINHVLRLPMEFFSQRNIGDLLQRQSLNETITTTLVNVLAPLVINIGMLLLYSVLMLLYSVQLTIIGFLVATLNLALMLYFSNLRINQNRTLQQSDGKYYSATVSCIDNIESIKAAGAETGFFEYWSGLFTHRFNISNDIEKQNIVLDLMPMLLRYVANAMVLILGARLILEGRLSIGMLLAFQGYMGSFMEPVTSIVDSGETLTQMRSQMERIEDVMKYPEDRREGPEVTVSDEPKLGGQLEMRNVTFGYNPNAAPLITDFNLKLEPGRSVAFVGTSGCGKSTLAKLVSGLYKPWKGEILFDGRPIETISGDEFTNSVAVIDQNVVLFDDTVMQNIRMWDTSIEDFTTVLACYDAQIHKDIVTRPEGFSTKLVKGGQNFSGGQRQRMEIATALAREPSILILDEATSALDPTTEEHVMQALRDRDITLIIIAHRLSTIRDCDEIIVMDHGVVMQRGTHEELISCDGLYKDLMHSA